MSDRAAKRGGEDSSTPSDDALTTKRLVSVRETPDESTATMLCDFLRDQGIEATAVAMQIPWFGTIETARQGFWGRVEVLEHHAERARKLIEDFYAAKPEPESPSPGDENGDR